MQAQRERRAHIRAHTKQHRAIGWKLLAIAVTGTAAALGMTGTAFAATTSHAGYGPPPPPAVTPPGGFTAVVTTVTIGPAGGVVGPVTVDPASLSVTVPAGAFTKPMQVTVTEPDLAQITPMPGFYNVSGAGVIISYDGVKYTGTFAKPVTVTFSSDQISPASKLLVWTGSAFDVASDSMAATGYAMASFSHDPYYVVQSPTQVPRATAPVTGEPFLGEGLLAGLFVLAGAGGVVLSRRRVRALPAATAAGPGASRRGRPGPALPLAARHAAGGATKPDSKQGGSRRCTSRERGPACLQSPSRR